MQTPNRHIMYRKYIDGDISKSEYEAYLAEQESREREADERFHKACGLIGKQVANNE